MFTTLPEVAWTGPFRNAVRVGLDCSRGIEHTVQVLAAHCVLKQSSDIVASPGIVLAPALSRHTHRHTHTHTHMHAHAHTYTNTNARANTLRRAHTHTHAHTHKHTCTRAHTYTRTNTQAHTRAYACTRCARDGLRQFFSVASNAPTLSVSWFAINSFMCPGCFGS